MKAKLMACAAGHSFRLLTQVGMSFSCRVIQPLSPSFPCRLVLSSARTEVLLWLLCQHTCRVGAIENT